MKYIVRILVIAEVIGLITGSYLINNNQEILGNKIIGFSALGLAFVVMPVFIIYRFSKSDKSKSIFSPTEKNEELEDLIKGDKTID
ncbi:hypothetical protein [Aquimarina agarivorans]|uniref:hypothetical protein n=1 Tax=Aquimarina agarivorans TaxID=980584 RepID=UPI000248E884|nr:hypothetical protein [Aquimarina agarivorans]